MFSKLSEIVVASKSSPQLKHQKSNYDIPMYLKRWKDPLNLDKFCESGPQSNVIS